MEMYSIYVSTQIYDSLLLHSLYCKKSQSYSPVGLRSHRKLHEPVLSKVVETTYQETHLTKEATVFNVDNTENVSSKLEYYMDPQVQIGGRTI